MKFVFMVAQKTSASSSHEASISLLILMPSFLIFFLVSVEEKAYEKVGNVFTFQIYKCVKDILDIWHVSTTTVTYNF